MAAAFLRMHQISVKECQAHIAFYACTAYHGPHTPHVSLYDAINSACSMLQWPACMHERSATETPERLVLLQLDWLHVVQMCHPLGD